MGTVVLAALLLSSIPVNAEDKDPTKDWYRPPDALLAVHALVVSKGNTIKLSHSACQFVEPEGNAHDLYVTFADDCRRENSKTKKERLPELMVLTLEPGIYKFRIENMNVPFPVGLEIYEVGDKGKKAKKPVFSEGEILTGYHKVFEIELKEGLYVYSGKQNITLDYPMVVSGDVVTVLGKAMEVAE